jgi:hypothetical protein
MQKEKKTISRPRKIARIFLKTILFIVLFILLVFVLVLTPPVQRYLTTRVKGYLEKKLQTRVEIGSIRFGLSGKVTLKDVYLEDKTKDTLLSGGMVRAQINYFRLFSNEVSVKDLEFENITAKIKRVLPDTVFNFQFIVNAFTSEKTKSPDTASSAPLKLNISDIALQNVHLIYNDVITGNDVSANIGNLSATIDTLDPYVQHFDIPTLTARNVRIHVKQVKPLVIPKPLDEKIAVAVQPIQTKLNIGSINLEKINIDYGNDVSAFYTVLNIGQLQTSEKLIDLLNNKIYLNRLALNNSKIAIRLGKKEAAKVVAKEVKKEIVAQKQAGWDIRMDQVSFANNTFQFDNDNNPKQATGIDFGHLFADSLTLIANNFVMDPDSIAGQITKAAVKEKSGFRLNDLRGDFVYANNITALRNIYIKTPGSEIQRSAVLEYASFDALTNRFPETVMDIQLVNSRVQVKDILVFAPQLRSNPAMRDPDAVWAINIVGNGTLNRLHFDALQFDGLSNTHINAKGDLIGIMDPQHAGGNFTIYRLHTTQTDMALFTGKRLSTPQINLPETFDINGNISGNAGRLLAHLNVNTSSGFVAVNGSFDNIMNPNSAGYNASIRTSRLRLGTIMRQPAVFGDLTGNFTLSGRGMTPASVNANVTAAIGSFGYNGYAYRNINAKGSIHQTVFDASASIKDPNADMHFAINGNFSSNPAFTVHGMIDSIKTGPLHLTPQPVVFRGKIDGTVSNLGADNPDANVLISNALLISGKDRQALDTVQFNSGKNAGGNYMQLRSDIANIYLSGKYRLADLPSVFQNSIQPYFAVKPPAMQNNVQPYDFNFTADIAYFPVLTSLVPGLTTMDSLHASGNISNTHGMNFTAKTAHVIYNGNDITGLTLAANTSSSGLNVTAEAARVVSGNSFDLYHTRLNAVILNNNISFSFGTDDANARNKYHINGVVTQPVQGTYAIQVKPDSLLLNYEKWTVNPDNQVIIASNNITAKNFVLQQGQQKLTLNSLAGAGQPLQVNFSNFRLATITGFIKADSVLVDGTMNGEITFRNLMQQPVFTSDLTINDLSMHKDTIGNVRMQVSSGSNNQYITNATITGRGNDVSLTGSFTPVGNTIRLDLEADVRALQLHSIQGALGNAITNASGAVNGRIKIAGTTNNPDIKGDLNFDKASFALSMLGSQFKLDGQKLSVTQDGFVFNNFTIRDSANNELTLDGSVLTNNFINYEFNLDVNATNFEVLNTTKAKNKIYYGKLTVSTAVHISGTEIKPAVDGSVTVDKGTNLYVVIPQNEPGVVQREGIVEFVDMDSPMNDSLFRNAIDTINTVNVLGFDIAANIEINKDAILNVIVDEANGDFINVQGEGLLTAGIDPSGKITLTGTYTLERGAYQLSFNFIQRKFDIEKGSTITWTGEPTSAELRVKAMYVANTAPLDLVASEISAPTSAIRNTYLQKLPFEVHLDLTGELMKPVVAFSIVLPENKSYGVSNDIITAVQAKLAELSQDEGETNKQVFALLLLNRFVGQNPFQSEGGGGFNVGTYARESVSRLLTEQLNQLAAGLVDGVDINFDVVSTDDYTTGARRSKTDLNIGLSKRLLNDRLKISVGNDFQLEGPQSSRQQNNNIAGNIAVDYQISRDGRYALRFYRQNEYEGIVDGYIVATGMSFILSIDYNKLTDLLHRRKEKVTPDGVSKKGTQ